MTQLIAPSGDTLSRKRSEGSIPSSSTEDGLERSRGDTNWPEAGSIPAPFAIVVGEKSCGAEMGARAPVTMPIPGFSRLKLRGCSAYHHGAYSLGDIPTYKLAETRQAGMSPRVIS